ncbi:MAG: sigma-54-dependent Fis family transcriptional regulator [Planctomycetes bacterium]|nr:sigma-54-dependent Fis family transcriptional regulator [Planctomycetota bacterium]
MKKQMVLLVEDNQRYQKFIKSEIANEHEVITASTGEEGLEKLKEAPKIILLDMKLPYRHGETADLIGPELLIKIKEKLPLSKVIIITGTVKDISMAVDAIKKGAYDYIAKDELNIEDLLSKINRGIREIELINQNINLRSYTQELSGRIYDYGNLIGKASKILEIKKTIKKIASAKTTVLITGESGTGKELIASAIHNNGNRESNPFVAINCAAMPDTLLENELFGHEKEAFTSADSNKKGKFEIANEGTLFLDEIGDMSRDLQAKLLRVLQEGEFDKVGGAHPIKIDVRIIAATNQNLEKMIETGDFREDLYYRLNVVPIHLPPLRERKEDIPDLVNHFIEKYNKELNRHFRGVSKEALDVMKEYHWKGNVRELENVIERAIVLGEEPEILLSDLPLTKDIKNEDITIKLSILELPGLSDTLKKLGLNSYLDIEERELQGNIFIRTYVECEGNLEKVRKRLKLGEGRMTIDQHFKRVREQILVSLCKASGNIENLAEAWNVDFIILLNALKSNNRMHKFLKGEIKKYGSMEKVAKRMDVDLEILEKSMKRIQ